MAELPPLAVTMGEPAGVGGELAVMAWRNMKGNTDVPFFLIDDAERIRTLAGSDLPVAVITHPDQAAAVFATALPLLHHPLPHLVAPGHPDPANAATVAGAIERAVHLAQAGEIAGLVTNPIHKETLYRGGFRFPGHTEYLASLAGGCEVAMMLANPALKVVPVTIHLALKEAIAALTTERIVSQGRIVAVALARDFGIARPRLAVAGLNPHAGEGGAMGREDIDIVVPAVAELRRSGIEATGPLPADTLFHAEARATYDAVLCMYHDQALIPVKTIDFFGGVNVTLGLPFIRTSPDHGTAFALAGTGQARPESLIAAITLAGAMARHRHG